MSLPRRVLGSAVLVAVVGAGNVVRETCWTQADGFVCDAFATGPLEARIPPIRVAGLTRVHVPAPVWRPFAIELRLAGGGAVRVSERPDERGVVVEAGRTVALVAQRPSATPFRVDLWAEPVANADINQPTLQITALRPVLAPGPLLASLLAGTAIGAALAWTLFFWRPAPASPPSDAPLPADGIAAWLVPMAILAVAHGAWIVLKPPLQSPDEPQHQARATSVPHAPYVAGAWSVPLAAAYRNPLTWTPNRLHGIIFKTTERLSDGEIRSLKATAWPPPGTYPAEEAVPSPIASYPPLYYWMVFAGGEAATWVLGLSPYASLLAYRAASVLMAGGVWLAIYNVMRRTPELRPWALPAFIVLAANPATASITSSVNADALLIPATILLLLATWRRLAGRGGDALILFAAALAVAAKPSGLLATAAAAAGASWWAWRRPASRPACWAAVRSVSLVSLAALVLFYAWSPPRFVPDASNPVPTLAAYGASVLERVPSWWVQYWGRLGWLEYSAPAWWYWLLLGACALLVVVAWWHPVPSEGFDRFVAIAAIAYLVLLCAGEYANAATASLVIQGRYLLPVSLALVPLVRQRSRALTWAMPVLLVALHVALAQATVARYFAGGWAAWLASLR